MKLTMNLVLACVMILTLGSCELFEDSFKHKKEKKKKFYAEFFTELTPTDDVRACEAPFDIYVNQEGEGIGKGLGSFTTRVDFCVNFSTLEYRNGQGSFVFNNGDKIYYTVAGQIMPSDKADYDLMFMDPFIITGGTGRFEGVSGGGMTDSYVKQFEGGDKTDHIWEGEIIYP